MPTPDILTLHARSQPDKLAVIDDRPDGTRLQWTFAELEAEANRAANFMREWGVCWGDKVVWCGRNSLGVVRMMHAARKIGATAVPLNYRLSPEEASYVVDNCDAVLAYTDAEYAGLFAEIRGKIPKVRDVVCFDGAPGPGMLDGDALLARSSDAELRVEEGDEAAATMIYTSGTTGKPKGALRRGGGDPEQVRGVVGVIGYVPEDIYLTTGPLYHSGPGGFMGISHALSHTVVLQRKFDPEDWLRLVARHRVSTCSRSSPSPDSGGSGARPRRPESRSRPFWRSRRGRRWRRPRSDRSARPR